MATTGAAVQGGVVSGGPFQSGAKRVAVGQLVRGVFLWLTFFVQAKKVTRSS